MLGMFILARGLLIANLSSQAEHVDSWIVLIVYWLDICKIYIHMYLTIYNKL